LRDLADRVIAGDVDKGNAAIGAQVLNVYLRAVSVEMRLKEQTELEDRIAQLETYAGHNDSGRRTWRA